MVDQIASRRADPRFMWEVLGPHRRAALSVLCLVLIDTALASIGVGMVLPLFQALLDPEFRSPLFDTLFPFLAELDPADRLLVVAGITTGLFLCKAIVSSVTVYCSHGFLLRLRFYWVRRIGEGYLFGKISRVSGEKQGALVNNWYNETLAASRFFQSSLAYFSSGALALTIMGLGFLVSWKGMLVLFFAGGLLVVLLQRPLYGKAAGLSKTKLETNQAIIAAMSESLSNVRELKLLQAEPVRLGQIDGLCTRLRGVLLRSAILGEAPRVIGEFLTVIALMSFLAGGVVWFAQHPEQILPVIAFFFVAFYRLVNAVISVMSSRVKSLNELHSVHMIHNLIKSPEGQESSTPGAPITRLTTDIGLEAINYSHKPGQLTLRSVNALIPLGKSTLLLGPSGSGKSTLLDLLFRFIEPDEGHIIANGHSIKDYALRDWRGLLGYVSQEAALFNGTIAMNLRIGATEVSDDEMRRVCELVGADDFITAFPNGYDTIVGDRGHTVSGGQRKRIAIARALLRHPAVLILDEATAAIEHSLEQSVLKTVRRAYPDLTLIVVTHRPNSLPDADWVIAMKAGAVEHTGPWRELKSTVLSQGASHEAKVASK